MNSLDFRIDELPLSRKMAGAMKTSDPAIPVCLSQLIRENSPEIPYGGASIKMRRQDCPLFLGRVKTFLSILGGFTP